MKNKIEAFIKKIKKLNLCLIRKNDNLVLRGVEGKLTSEDINRIKKDNEIIDFIKSNKVELIKYLDETKSTPQLYKLSPLQEGILFHGLYDKESGAYLVQLIADFKKGLDIDSFHASWEYLIMNHSILRSAFFYKKLSAPIQRVYNSVVLPYTELDYSSYSELEQQQKIALFLKSDKELGFSFSEAPLIRISIIKIGKLSYKMIFTNHHIILDGWSISILIEEFLRVYKAISGGMNPPKRKKDVYEDYIKYIAGKNLFEEESFWKEYIKGLDSSCLLPFSRSEMVRNKAIGEYKETTLVFDKNYTEKLKNYAKSNRLTVNTIIQGVWALLLWKYTGKKDVVYGVTVSGRPTDIEKSEERIGLYINTLPFYSQLDENEMLTEWLAKLQLNHTSCREYQYTSLAKIKELTGIQGDLFDSVLVFENYPISNVVSEGEGILENIEVKEHNNYLLGITVDLEKELTIEFSYNNALLEEVTINMIRGHFQQVLDKFLGLPQGKLLDVSILTKEEEYRLIQTFNDTETTYPLEKNFVDLFSKQVAHAPDDIAIISENITVTYKELDEKSNQLAHYLSEKGIGEDDLVGICLDRSSEMIIGIVGILKSGAAYVPIKPNYPISRISYILKEIECKALVTDVVNESKLPNEEKICKIVLEYSKSPIKDYSKTALEISIPPSSLAYLIYTSGSTGTPKGAMIEHAGMLNHLLVMRDSFEIDSDSVIAFTAPFTFDISVWQMLTGLLCGGNIVVYKEEIIREVPKFLKAIYDQEITILQLVPSFLSSLLDMDNTYLERLKYFLVTGETVLKALVTKWFTVYPNIPLVNAYGPTEAADDVSFCFLNKTPNHPSIPIGKPISNIELYIVDSTGCLCPIGVTGELLVSGIGVGRGYLNDEVRTKHSFIDHPFKKNSKYKVYKTGDLARWLPDGNIEFVGRKDDQVKIRGHRIELGEIEEVLSKMETINACCVLAKEDAKGDNRLIGYVVVDGEIDKTGMQEHLMSIVPEYMVPMIWVSLDEMPLTNNGKIDKKLLLAPDQSEISSLQYVAPRNKIEEQLISIYQKLLGIEKVGILDNFFELGGHSLLATRLVSMIRLALEIEIEIKDIFRFPKISELGFYIITQSKEMILPSIISEDRPERIPLSFGQERLWFLDQLQGSSVEFHIPIALQLEGALDINVLATSFKEILSRHEILRTVIKSKDGIGYQKVLSPHDWSLEYFIIGATDNLDELLTSYLDTPFDLSLDYMLRICLFKLSENSYILAGTFHHIAFDGWSVGIFVRELAELYDTLIADKKPTLNPLLIQYADYAIWQRNYLEGHVLDKQLSYWRNQLQNISPLILPTDYQRPIIQSKSGSNFVFELNEKLTFKLERLSKKEGTTLFMTLLAAFKVLLYKYCNQQDIAVGTTIANRTQEELGGIIGFFVNTLVLRSDLSDSPRFIELLHRVKNTTLDAYDHQHAPFEKVVDQVITTRDMGRSPLFQVMFELMNTSEEVGIELNDLKISPYEHRHSTTQYDLTYTITEIESHIVIDIQYCTALFKESTIRRMVVHYEELLWNIVSDPFVCIRDISMLTNEEEYQLLKVFNNTFVDYPLERTFVDLFEEQVRKRSGATALVYGNQELTYEELDVRSNQVSHYLAEQGVVADEFVCICIERSIEMIIGILGVLKSGGAYVPIKPDYPESRISYILEETESKVVLTDQQSEDKFTDYTVGQVMTLDRLDVFSTYAKTSLGLPISPASLSYVIYTSGSTGTPKGAMIEHQGMLNHLLLMINDFDINADSRVAFTAPFTFDISVWQELSGLLCGGQIHVYSEELIRDPGVLQESIFEDKITHLQLVPSYVSSLLDTDSEKNLSQLSYFFVTGEAVHRSLLVRWFDKYPDIPVVNAYGPTEASDDVSFHVMREVPESSNIPIGKPVSNMQLYVVDPQGILCPLGVVGELWISGVGVGRGYLNDAEKTSNSFIVNPFDVTGDTRVYKSGDLARWLPDGSLEYLGRKDDQVKIRGHRIELGEIENVLSEVKGVDQCVVLASPDTSGNDRLVGYVVQSSVLDKGFLETSLLELLPEYMVPRIWMSLESFPLTSNGKIDKHSLPDPELSELSTQQYMAPRNKIEEDLVTIWQELLGVTQVGVFDNFFELGGHSIMALKLAAKIAALFQKKFPVSSFFEYQTIAELAKKLGLGDEERNKILISIQSKGDRRPIFCAPPGGGTVICYRELSRLLGINQPFYAFQSPGIDERSKVLETVEEMATVFITEMQRIDPVGPYRLGGYSFGGKIALEMALQLQKKGYKISELLIFDATPMDDENDNLEELIKEFFIDVVEDVNEEFDKNILLKEEDLLNKSNKQRKALVYKLLMEAEIPLDDNQIKGHIEVGVINVSSRYFPEITEKLHTDIILFKTKLEEEEKQDHIAYQSESYLWQEFTDREVVICNVLGTHGQLLEIPYVEEIAKRMQFLLKEEDANQKLIDPIML